MSIEVSSLIPQPEFPEVDLREENVNMLAVLLANQLVVSNAHRLADRNDLLFRAAHPATVDAAEHLFDAGAKVAAVEHGVMVFEAMTTRVLGEPGKKTNKAVYNLEPGGGGITHSLI